MIIKTLIHRLILAFKILFGEAYPKIDRQILSMGVTVQPGEAIILVHKDGTKEIYSREPLDPNDLEGSLKNLNIITREV